MVVTELDYYDCWYKQVSVVKTVWVQSLFF